MRFTCVELLVELDVGLLLDTRKAATEDEYMMLDVSVDGSPPLDGGGPHPEGVVVVDEGAGLFVELITGFFVDLYVGVCVELTVAVWVDVRKRRLFFRSDFVSGVIAFALEL